MGWPGTAGALAARDAAAKPEAVQRWLLWTETGYKLLSAVRAVAGEAGHAYASAMAGDMHRQVAHSPCHILLVTSGDAWYEHTKPHMHMHDYFAQVLEPHRQLRCQRRLINGRRAFRSTADSSMLLWFNNITGSWVMSWERVFLGLRWTSPAHDDDHRWLGASDASASPTLASSWASTFDSTDTGWRFVSGADIARARHREAAFITERQAAGAATVYLTAPLDSPHLSLTGEYKKQPGVTGTAVAMYLRTPRAKNNLSAASLWWARGVWHIGCSAFELVASPADYARYDPPELFVPNSWKLNRWSDNFEPGLRLDGPEVGAPQLHAMQREAEDRFRGASETVWILADSTKATFGFQCSRCDSTGSQRWCSSIVACALFGEYHRVKYQEGAATMALEHAPESILAAGRWVYKPKKATNGSNDVPILAAYEIPDHKGSCKTSIVWMLHSPPVCDLYRGRRPNSHYHCGDTRDTFRSSMPFAWDAAHAAEHIDSSKWSWPIQVATGASSSVCVTSDNSLPWQFSGLLGSYKLGGVSADGRVFYCRDIHQHSSDYCLQHWYGEPEAALHAPFKGPFRGTSTSFWTFHEGLAKEPFEIKTFRLYVVSDATFAENIDGLFETPFIMTGAYWFGAIPWIGRFFVSPVQIEPNISISACEPSEPLLPETIVRPITRSFKHFRHLYWNFLSSFFLWSAYSIVWMLGVYKAASLCGWIPQQDGVPQTPAARTPTPQTFWPPALDVERIPSSALVPRAFVCPITMGPMANPAVTPRGTSYDREALREWCTKWHRYPGGEVRAALPANCNHTARC